MNICRVVWDYPEGGLPSYGLQPVFYYLSQVQADQGHDVNVVARKVGSQPTEEVDGNVIVHRVDPPFNVNGLRKVRGIIKNRKDSIVHTHATAGLFMSLAKHLLKVPLVAHVHGTTHSHFMPVRLEYGDLKLGYSPIRLAYYHQREKLLWSSADRVVTVSRVIIRDLERFYSIPGKKIIPVYNGVDTDLFRPIEPNGGMPKGLEKFEGKQIILYVGHFGLRKGLIYLLAAMSEITKEIPDVALVCIGGVPSWLKGGDYWKMLRTQIEDRRLSDSVVLMDRIPNRLLPHYYSYSSVFVLPSYYESFSKVVAEAMACGKPVISTKKGALEEVVENGVSGTLVDYGSSSQLSKAIIEILQDQKLALKMGRKGRERAETLFTWKAVARRLDKVYNSLNGSNDLQR